MEELNGKLKKYKLICFFCGVRMNHETVNVACETNKKKEGVEKRF